MNINFIGTIFGTSGYSSHSRQLVNALYKQNKDIALNTIRMPECETQVNDAELEMMKKEPYKTPELTIAVMMPNQWASLIPTDGSKFYGYCVWEGSNVPKYWLKYFADERVTKILVPSNHTKHAILNSVRNEFSKIEDGFQTKIEIDHKKQFEEKILLVPHGVDHSLFKPRGKMVSANPFTFMMNGGWAQGMNDRKGIQFGIQAFNQEFSKDEPVQMMVKINMAYCYQGWDLNNEISKLELRENGGTLNISLDTMPFEKLPELYSYGDVFVAPNMSEAFGLPIAEAMSCGLPVITTGFGGQTDFVTKDNGWLVPHDLIDVDWDLQYEGVQWAKPQMDNLKFMLRYIYEHQEDIENKRKQALKDIKKYSWDNSAKIILEAK